MLELIVLGIIQGISEWLPVSSEGLLFLVKANFFGGGEIEAVLKQALFLHLGTFLAASVYLRKDVIRLLKAFLDKKNASYADWKTISFLVWTTLISGLMGILIINFLSGVESEFEMSSKLINLGIGILLLVTAFLQIKSSKDGGKYPADLRRKDGIFLGFMQGLAALPGLSRSGLTVSGLLLRRFDEYYALRLSFLMSLPIVLAGNIVLNLEALTTFSLESFAGLAASFVFGILTIGGLLKIAEKVNFGYFVFGFAALLLLSVFV